MVATIKGMRGWECGNTMVNTADYSVGPGGSFSVLSTSKTGTYSLSVIGTNFGATYGRFLLPGTPANPAVSVWIKHGDSSYTENSLRLRFRLDTGTYIDLRWNGVSHTLDAYVNDVLFASGTVEVSVNDWFHVQCYLTVSDTGNITVVIDGHESINQNGDTKPSTETGAKYVYLYCQPRSAYFDNFVFWRGRVTW